MAAYRPLDAKSADYLSSLSLLPQPQGGVCMRENNWEYALDCSAGAGNCYACERGEAYLSWWGHGLGIDREGAVQPEWHVKRDLIPRAPSKVAIEIGVRYALKDDI